MITIIKTAGIAAVGILFGFILCSHTMGKTSEPRIIKSCLGHFTGTEDADRVILVEPQKGSIDNNFIALYQNQDGKESLLWKSPPSPVWDVFFADINGDRIDELAVCFYKSEPRDTRKDNRLQIFAWKNDTVTALWRGTFLSKPFIQITFGNITGDIAQELITIEKNRLDSEKYYLCIYSWNGFGFDLLAETELVNSPDNVSVKSDSQNDIELKYQSGTINYFFLDNKLILRRQIQ